ncbi:hypothetical protein PG993_009143 [Apiospora rasikravindrae]|uniref:Uncharacterized protein n=1 Tax=Apiospora rasikravindrae TaxID=990691 RepID=A0ABR1SIL7_9PEZI
MSTGTAQGTFVHGSTDGLLIKLLFCPVDINTTLQQRLDIGRDVDQRPLRAVPGPRTGHLRINEILRDGEDVASKQNGCDSDTATRQQAVGDGHGAAKVGRNPGRVGRVQHVRARNVIRHQNDLAAPARRNRNTVKRRSHAGAAGARDGHGHRHALLGRHVEPVEPAVGAVGDQQGLAVRRGHEAAEALDGMVGGRLEVPSASLAVGGDADERAGESADGEAGAVGVVGDVLVAAVDAVGHGREVGLPQDFVGGQVILDQEVVARDVGAGGVEGAAGVYDHGEAVTEGVHFDAAEVQGRVIGEAGDGQGLLHCVCLGIPYGDG